MVARDGEKPPTGSLVVVFVVSGLSGGRRLLNAQRQLFEHSLQLSCMVGVLLRRGDRVPVPGVAVTVDLA